MFLGGCTLEAVGNAWKVAEEVTNIIDDKPGPAGDYMKCYVTTRQEKQFFFNTTYLLQYTSTKSTVDLAELVLRNNNFEFNENHYLQTLGMAIGTKMAPSYANLFTDRLERRLLSQAQVKPYIWLRYIDDVFMVWTGTELELVEFLNYINEAHDTIKFTWDWSIERINYLDVQVIKLITMEE